MLSIASLNSGSNGNCYYIGNEHEAVLIDAGISCRETEKRMLRLGLSMKTVKAIFISHEHSDHISGVSVLAKKHQIPVYITPSTMESGRLSLEEHLVVPFAEFDTIVIGSLQIHAFPKKHDARHPHSFTITCNNVTVGVFTDIGTACDQVIRYFSQCHAAFLEANYDDDLLDKGGYPYHLKRRIRGGFGHLSNKQALSLFLTHKPAFMTHLLLSHLSKNNNDPQLVKELFDDCSDGVQIIVASRHEETDVFYVERTKEFKINAAIVFETYQPTLF